jgi:hypothetical protein
MMVASSPETRKLGEEIMGLAAKTGLTMDGVRPGFSMLDFYETERSLFKTHFLETRNIQKNIQSKKACGLGHKKNEMARRKTASASARGLLGQPPLQQQLPRRCAKGQRNLSPRAGQRLRWRDVRTHVGCDC